MARSRARRRNLAAWHKLALASCGALVAMGLPVWNHGMQGVVPFLAGTPAVSGADSFPSSGQPLEEALGETSGQAMLGHVRFLAERIGPRAGGSAEEQRAGEYILAALERAGLEIRVQDGIPIGRTGDRTRNIEAIIPGSHDESRVILGAHYDSYVGRQVSPGANDNASGVAVLLELARNLKTGCLPFEVRLVFFGAEEYCGDPPVHHTGSSYYVRSLRDSELARVAAMVSVDMVGASLPRHANRIGVGSDRARLWLMSAAATRGASLRTDNEFSFSDHEAFELAGVPSVCLTQFGEDPRVHTPGDRAGFVTADALLTNAQLCLAFLGRAARDLDRG